MKRLISAVSTLCVLLTMTTLSPAATLQEKLDREKASLDSLNTMLERTKAILSKTQKQKENVGSELDRLEKDKIRTKRELRELSVREKSLSQRVNRTRTAFSDAERKLERREADIVGRLRTSYKLSRQDPLAVLLSGSSLSEAVRRLKYLGRAAHQDRVDLAALATAKDNVRRALKLRQVQHTHQQTLVLAKRRKERQVVSTASAFDLKLRNLSRDEKRLKEETRKFNEQIVEGQNQIQEIIKEIERQRLAGGRLVELPDFDFAAKQGALPWPVRGKILTRFGRFQDPDLGTWTMNPGVTIGAEAGADVLTIAPGEVVLVDWWRGFGQLVLLRHPAGYYSFYSHLDSRSVETGEILAEGALIGTVGSTGRLDGIPQLHFQIIKDETPVDPAIWLEP